MSTNADTARHSSHAKTSIKPRYFGRLVFRGNKRMLHVNNRSKFLAPVITDGARSNWIFGALLIRVLDGSSFDLHVNEGSPPSIKIRFFTSRGFPFIGLRKASKRIGMCFIFFANKISANEHINFEITQVNKEYTKTYSIGDLRGISKPNHTEHSNPNELAQIEHEILTEISGKPLSADRYFEYASRLIIIKASRAEKSLLDRLHILLNSAAHRNHAPTRKNLRKQLVNHHQNGETDLAEALERKLKKATKPYILGPHGYRLPLSTTNLTNVLLELKELISNIAELGAESCISSGTLLGFIRDGMLLPHDDDIDISVLIHGANEKEIAQNWSSLMNGISTRMPIIHKYGFIAVELPCGIEVDLFPMWVLDRRVYAYPYLYGEVSESVFFPLIERDWAGVKIPTPTNPEHILSVNYGDDWQKHDPYWSFDWVKAKFRFSYFLKHLKRSL